LGTTVIVSSTGGPWLPAKSVATAEIVTVAAATKACRNGAVLSPPILWPAEKKSTMRTSSTPGAGTASRTTGVPSATVAPGLAASVIAGPS
jgi:hypothetical protein